jgi:hypothetical protein
MDFKDEILQMFTDFSVMGDRSIREKIAGGKTGPEGVDTVECYGFVNLLKDCDAAVQWALFMPFEVERQQNGFRVERFEYKKLPDMRFIGREYRRGTDMTMFEELKQFFSTLDAMNAYKSGFDYDVLFQHIMVGAWMLNAGMASGAVL